MTSHQSKHLHVDSRGMVRKQSSASRPSTRTAVIGLAAAGLAVSAFVNHRLARKAEHDNPPAGQFLTVNGVRLHYVERGSGEPLVLLHGNGSMIQDFEASGLIDLASRKYRVIAIDRPGFGHSDRPRNTIWTAEAQADLIHDALRQLGVERATILGHSWGCSVAVALAHKYPDLVAGLVLASGYYYPTARADVVGTVASAIPVVGDVLRYTISPILGRLTWPLLMRTLFGPQAMPEKFAGFPKAMAVRPSQIRASAAEAALMVPGAAAAADTYAPLTMPVAIIVGADDRVVDADVQSARLHEDIPHSSFHRIPGMGHMIHQTATDAVMAAIENVAAPQDPPAWAEAA